MRTLLAVLLLSVCACAQGIGGNAGLGGKAGIGGGAGAAAQTPTFVASTTSVDLSGGCKSDAATACTTSYSPTAGNLVVVGGGMYVDSTGDTITSVTNDQGQTATIAFQDSPTGFTAMRYWVAAFCSVSAGVTSFSVNHPAGANHWPGYVVAEFSGVKGTGCQDQVAAFLAQSTSPYSTNPLTPIVTHELSIALFGQTTDGTRTYTGSNGWTCVNKEDPNTNLSALCYQTITGTSATTATATSVVALTTAPYQVLYLPGP